MGLWWGDDTAAATFHIAVTAHWTVLPNQTAPAPELAGNGALRRTGPQAAVVRRERRSRLSARACQRGRTAIGTFGGANGTRASSSCSGLTS